MYKNYYTVNCGVGAIACTLCPVVCCSVLHGPYCADSCICGQVKECVLFLASSIILDTYFIRFLVSPNY